MVLDSQYSVTSISVGLVQMNLRPLLSMPKQVSIKVWELQLAAAIKAHLDEILCVSDSRLTNGAVEGMNGLMQAAKARACGSRTARSLITTSYQIGAKLSPLPYTTRYCDQVV